VQSAFYASVLLSHVCYRTSTPSSSSSYSRLFRDIPFRDSRWPALRHGRGHQPWILRLSRVQLLATMYLRLLCADRRSSSEGENGVTRARRPRVSLQRPRSFNRVEGESNAFFCLFPLRVAVICDPCNGALDYPNEFLSCCLNNTLCSLDRYYIRRTTNFSSVLILKRQRSLNETLSRT